jgi:hypothetical protein
MTYCLGWLNDQLRFREQMETRIEILNLLVPMHIMLPQYTIVEDAVGTIAFCRLFGTASGLDLTFFDKK